MIDFQKVADVIEKAPAETIDLIFSIELEGELEQIAEFNQLTDDEYLQMVDEVGYIILGLKKRNNFIDSLIEFGISKELATSINKEVNEKVFLKMDKIRGIEKKQFISNTQLTKNHFDKKQTEKIRILEKQKKSITDILSSIK
jgi:hypothetical protein